MNKTFTTIMASVAVASLAVAIETDPAGYLESSAELTCNPFGTFNTKACLADLDGSQLNGAYIRIVSTEGLATSYYWDGTTEKWYTEQNGKGTDSSAVSLPRGTAVQVVGDGILVAAGPLVNEAVADQELVKGFKLYGNASVALKKLSDITVKGTLNPNTDYLRVGSDMYVTTDGSAWYEKSAYDAGLRNDVKNSVTLAPGQGIVFFRQKPRRGSLSEVTVDLPGTY